MEYSSLEDNQASTQINITTSSEEMQTCAAHIDESKQQITRRRRVIKANKATRRGPEQGDEQHSQNTSVNQLQADVLEIWMLRILLL